MAFILNNPQRATLTKPVLARLSNPPTRLKPKMVRRRKEGRARKKKWSKMAAMAMVLLGLLGMAMAQGEAFKVEKFALYIHDKITTPNATGVRVAGPNGDTTTTQFGSLFVIDNIITAEQSNTSAQIGRAKGTFMVASVDESYAFLAFSAVLNTNETLAFQGTDASVGPTSSKELAIVGGTGDFWLALGFANYTTFELDIPDSTDLLNCTVFLPNLHPLVSGF